MMKGARCGDVPRGSTMTPRLRAALSFVAVLPLLASACQANEYPECGAFEFGDLQRPPRLVDDAASPVDCGRFRVVGPVGAPVVEDPTGLDCALEHLADGQPMQVEYDQEPDDAWGRSAAVFSDVGGVALRWQRTNEDLVTDFEAKVIELDVGRLDDCRELASAGERFTCLHETLAASRAVRTCETRRLLSE
jgi:hypothetical protein